ncbi:MAG: response regulator [Cytophagales bacterium]|nr:response regulator [Cytophagales bacterium]
MQNPPIKILLIDDDPTINYLNKLVIDMSPVEAKVCERTEANVALEELSSGQIEPELILLDINMPEMDGWDFAQSYESLPKNFQKSKIVILTSSINPRDKEKAETNQVINGFFSKPLTIDSIQEITKTVLN